MKRKTVKEKRSALSIEWLGVREETTKYGADSSTPNAQRSTLNAQRSTPDAQRSTSNAQRLTLNAQRSTPDAQRSTPNAQRSTLNAQRSTPNAQRSTPDAQRPTLNAQRSTLNAQRSTPNAQRSTPDAQRPTPNAQRSTPDAQRSTPDAQRSTSNAQRPAFNTQWQKKPRFDLEERLLEFSASIIELVDELPNTRAANHVAGQLLRCGTSPYGNHGEVEAAESRRDFVHKLRICLKELKETRRWLGLIQRTAWLPDSKTTPILTENEELIRIFFSSIRTAEKNAK